MKDNDRFFLNSATVLSFLFLVVGMIVDDARAFRTLPPPVIPTKQQYHHVRNPFLVGISQQQQSSSSSTRLEMARVKRGKLASNVSSGSSSKQKRKKTSSSSSMNKKKAEANISPALSDWVSSQQQGDDSTVAVKSSGDDNDDSATTSTAEAAMFTSFKEETTKSSAKQSKRRSKQQERMAEEEERNRRISSIIKNLEETLDVEKKSSLEEILVPIRQLVQEPTSAVSTSLRQLSASARRYSYRLAWVGSDDAICHLGTGLHKVPLARLQEVFLTLTGRNAIEINEVIRIIGPFPNVKNILQGTVNVGKNLGNYDDDVDTQLLQIKYDSMIDGAGKEILAGTEENIRKVDLHICYSDENALVAIVPPNPEDVRILRKDPLENNGSNVLVFVREDNLDEQLEKLRVL